MAAENSERNSARDRRMADAQSQPPAAGADLRRARERVCDDRAPLRQGLMPMHPRTPEMLSRLIGIADAILGETRVGRLRGDRARSVGPGPGYGWGGWLWGG